jgi:ubiquinone/menaquinone biosynthesis C-methylase UbiE
MESDRSFQGSIPALYDQYLGPMMFVPYAEDLVSRLVDLRRGRVLETAAGTGVVTRALAAALPDEVHVDSTDLNQPMIEHAAGLLSSPRVTWQQADAQSLPFSDGIFDVVICQFGVMFFPDKRQAFAEAHRVLKPGGRFVFSVWDRIETNAFTDIVVKSVAALFPSDPPRFLARIPHGHHDVAPLDAHLRAVGFTSVITETVTKMSSAPTAMAVATGFCQGTPMRSEIEARDATRLTEATEVAAAAIAAQFGPGPVTGQIQAHVVSATRA